METNSYDSIAQEYKDSKLLPFRIWIEAYTLEHLAGDVSGRQVLDLACGEGIYSRKLKQMGAADVLGVDLSAAMIGLATAAEAAQPLGCRYQVHDVLSLSGQGQFDLAVGMYLLNYARTREELARFCRVAFDHLQPGGRFIGFNDNPMNPVEHYGSYRPYGFLKESPPDRREGDYVRYTLFNPDGTEFAFDNFYLDPAAYTEAFESAGFADFRWEGPFLHPAEPAEPDRSYWDQFMTWPPLIGFSARRPD